MVQSLDSKASFDKALKDAGSKLVCLDFTATWCGPCKKISPVFEDLSTKNTDVDFFKVDVDDAEDVASACDISSMPTFIFFKDGKELHRFSGASAQMLEETVAKYK
mmetsp:Transcript_22501/g.31733  ORF Transcript_22501/g.31733 Transcript_22501/m.31733 type:complete len:106 (-) Transcript_22501:96-413(-)|eukprot:CAMPEP_0175096064 /NCGR_PEP_ID=MMETSP0086_2-20121207/4521_1 /TAXON_ID=136419 /ORGANISM="Unknown Unknown, Strain D1" /LENGTH=105 /DNA_ID=CAMNT_0016369417 /DNA_START=34 /DNA_END=351 /DNA_ORIENTATION=+